MDTSSISGERFTVLYNLYVDNEALAMDMAKDICYEQTVEFPHDLINDHNIIENVIGKIVDFKEIANGFQVKITYPIETTAFEFTQFLNILFGNISLKPNINLYKIELPEIFINKFKGPRFGIEGIRDILQVYNRPLLATALKPMGLTSSEMADLCYKFALGGIDIIKDDHGITNQIYSSYNERVEMCTAAVRKANSETGGNSIYVPNVTAGIFDLMDRVHFAKVHGAGGLLISPGITGFDTVRTLAENAKFDLPIICHPAFLGSFVLKTDGISPMALFGQLTRLAGGDSVIYPNFLGRFSFSKDVCLNIIEGCKMEMPGLKKILPAPGGGMSVDMIPELTSVYGNDVIYLIGGGLFRRSNDIVENSKYFKSLILNNQVGN